MMAVGMSYESVTELTSKYAIEDKVQVACINSPKSTTVSGDSLAIDQLFKILQNEGHFARKLKTDNKAYHSHSMKAIGHQYEELLSSILRPETQNCADGRHVRFYSSVTSRIAEKDVVSSAGYWRTNLESPVLFKGAIEEILYSGSYHFIEIGPHSVLEQPIGETYRSLDNAGAKLNYFSTLSRGKNAETSLLNLAGNLYLCGHTISFDQVNCLTPASSSVESVRGVQVMHSLPPYAWQHDTPLWSESRISSDFRNRRYPRHDLLGSRVAGDLSGRASWRNRLKVKEVHWLQDHKLGPTTVFPASAYVTMAVEGLCQIREMNYSHASLIKLHQVHILNVLILLDDSEEVEIITHLEPAKISNITSSSTWWHFEISSNSTDRSIIHANGLIQLDRMQPKICPIYLIPEETMEKQATRTWYDKLEQEGLHFGPTFRSLAEIQTDRRRTSARTISKTIIRRGSGSGLDQQSKYAIHPISLDAMLQTAIIASAMGNIRNLQGKIPVSIGSLEIATGDLVDLGAVCTIRAGSEKVGVSTVILGAELEDPQGHIIAQIRNVRAIANAATLLHTNSQAERNPALRIIWKPDILSILSNNTEVPSNHMDRFTTHLPKDFTTSDIGLFAGAFDLCTHQNPRAHVLELENDGKSRFEELLVYFGFGTSLKRFESYTKASMKSNGELSGYQIGSLEQSSPESPESPEPPTLKPGNVFDLVLIPPVSESNPHVLPILLHLLKSDQSACSGRVSEIDLSQLSKHLSFNAMILSMVSCSTAVRLDESRFSKTQRIYRQSDTSITITRLLSKERSQDSLTDEQKIIFVSISRAVGQFQIQPEINITNTFNPKD